MGELIATFRPERALELGCATGAVMQVLFDHGIHAEGLEISRSSYDRAFPEIRDQIHFGDLLTMTLPGDYDFIYGLDLFEHLNPNRLAQYLARLRAHARPGGWLFAVVPALGRDEVFGEVFPLYLPEWPADVDANRPFSALHCDDDGYPMHGHLIWAHTDWWVAQFAAAGFERRPDVERAVHTRYAHHLHDVAPARGSFYLFTAGPPDPATTAAVVERLGTAT
jgi:SAM-dependent methyltransferase